MLLEQIEDLELFGVYDRGVPNAERIVLRANAIVNLGCYAVGLGVKSENGMASPIPDQFLWLGEMYVDKGAWVFIFTGKGTPALTKELNTGGPMHVMYWHKDAVVLTHDLIVPMLYRFDGVRVGIGLQQVLQAAELSKGPSGNETTSLKRLLLETAVHGKKADES
jgi:hypothetical protein